RLHRPADRDVLPALRRRVAGRVSRRFAVGPRRVRDPGAIPLARGGDRLSGPRARVYGDARRPSLRRRPDGRGGGPPEADDRRRPALSLHSGISPTSSWWHRPPLSHAPGVALPWRNPGTADVSSEERNTAGGLRTSCGASDSS